MTTRLFALPALALLLVACSDADDGASTAPTAPAEDAGVSADAVADTAPPDAPPASPSDASDASDAAHDADAGNACAVYGAPGDCIAASACAMIHDHTAYAGHCSGPSTIECCIKTPNVADNPPIPTGYKLASQSQVTPAMTTWAVDILHDPTTYPMFSTTTKIFGALTVLARVEWHVPDFQNGIVHRGVTLYEPI